MSLIFALNKEFFVACGRDAGGAEERNLDAEMRHKKLELNTIWGWGQLATD